MKETTAVRRAAIGALVWGLSAGCNPTAKGAGPAPAESAPAPLPVLEMPAKDPCPGKTGKECWELEAVLRTASYGENAAPFAPLRGMALLEVACLKGHVPACTNAGLTWSDLDPMGNPPTNQAWCKTEQETLCALAPDPPRAQAFLLRACDAADWHACTAAARLDMRGSSGLPLNPGRAATLFERACASNVAEACHEYGRLLRLGRFDRDAARPDLGDEPENVKRALPFLEKACGLGHTDACGSLIALYFEGEGIPRQPGRAFAMLKDRCDKEPSDPLCPALLAHLYMEGIGTPKDATKALAIWENRCNEAHKAHDVLTHRWNGGGDMCEEAAFVHEQGKDVPEDRDRAKALYRISCEHKNDRACAAVKRLEE